ncbi:hypothetical protein XM38_010000 [Halomicronema hongdechloris C2206]|uniref:Uncharacterized protein n=1 Tax=Halomicronema hongdechloris C2206 TaxID=1641165 RepID=A0A1Z3HIF3_9CYAN|nr:hypothetical protein [Halomicronema hongdechloris]ASC70070.1 hypothetical protein XM38_010000 [Halomicronema hongdechloris C2206]
MNDEWAKQIWQVVDAVAHDANHWYQQLDQQLQQVSEQLADTSDEWAAQLRRSLEPEIDRWADDVYRATEPVEQALDATLGAMVEQVDAVVEPIVGEWIAGLDNWFEQLLLPVNNTLDPWSHNQPTCIGCRHYYGQIHGGSQLICAMHPYGPEDDSCPDWESVWTL